jgi:hypothetical protein
MKAGKRSRSTNRKGTRRSLMNARRSVPRTEEQFSARPDKFKDMWTRLVNAVSKMRGEKASLERASRESGISSRTVKRWAGSALQKSDSGKWSPKKNDNLLRVLIVPTEKGTREVGVIGSRRASELGEFWAGVQKALQTGDASGLKKLRGKKIRDANGEQILLLTDIKELNRLGSAGVFSFHSIYARST